jgi:hypothetical protein
MDRQTLRAFLGPVLAALIVVAAIVAGFNAYTVQAGQTEVDNIDAVATEFLDAWYASDAAAAREALTELVAIENELGSTTTACGGYAGYLVILDWGLLGSAVLESPVIDEYTSRLVEGLPAVRYACLIAV